MQGLKTRRRGLTLAVGAVIVALAVATVGAANVLAGTATAKHASAGCKPYGTLSYAIAGQGVPSLDPNTIANAAQAPLNSIVYEGLTQLDPNGNIVPELATKWKHSTDLKTWWFYIRHNVKYDDGRALTSADVVQNILRVLDPTVPSQARANIKDFRSVRALGKYEIRIKVGSPSSIVPAQLFLVRMSDLQDPTQLNTTGYGTGPYMVQSFVPNQSLTLVPNKYYSGPKTQCFAKIAFVREPDPTSMVTDFTAGKFGIAWNVPISAVPTVTADKRAMIVTPKTISSLDAWEVDTTSPPFNNPLARQALSYATDRAAMVKVALQGQGVADTGNSLINPNSPAYDKKLKPYTFDLQKAKQLFQQAGVQPGTTFTFWAESGARPEWVTMGQILQSDLQQIGYNLNIVQSDPSTWLAKFFPNPKSFPGLIVANFLSLQPNPTLALSFASSHKCECNWNNPTFDNLYAKALGAPTDNALQSYVYVMQAMEATQAPVLAIAHATNIIAVQKGIAGVWEDARGNAHLDNAYFTNANGTAK